MKAVLRIATRRSALALWQAEHVATALRRFHAHLNVELVPMTTEGDRHRSGTLSEMGGKGLFVKELEQAMLEGRADLAVHSMKDVPAVLPEGLSLVAFLRADDPRDVLVSLGEECLESLPTGARVGTASLRRRAQLLHLRPDLEVVELHGNVGTRLRRMDEGFCQAMLLARAGLQRLGLTARVRQSFDVQSFVPAINQGIIGIECRCDDMLTRQLVKPLHHPVTATRVAAERSLGLGLGGNCMVPVAGHARREGDRLLLVGLVASPDGRSYIRAELGGPPSSAAELGYRLAQHLLDAGAARILAELGTTT